MAQRAQLLEQKLELLINIAKVTERMGNLLQNDDLDALAVCIEEKSGYIEIVDLIDKGLMGTALPTEAPLFDKIREILRRIQSADQRNMELAKDMKSALAAQIREANQTRSLRSYGAPPPGIKFVDREG